MKVRLEFKAADCWVGAFWDRRGDVMHLWVCLVPMLPLHVTWPARGCCSPTAPAKAP